MEKLEANDSIFRTTGFGKLPHTILKMAAEDQRGRSDSGWDSVGKTDNLTIKLFAERPGNLGITHKSFESI